MSETKEETQPTTYEASCHCGQITFSVTLSGPVGEGKNKPLNCNCSICRRAGYLLVYPKKEDVKWHGDSRSKCGVYQFNTKTKDQLFCPRCGSSLGIYFQNEPWYGISARSFNGIDLDALEYRKLDGVNRVLPAADLSGTEAAVAPETHSHAAK